MAKKYPAAKTVTRVPLKQIKKQLQDDLTEDFVKNVNESLSNNPPTISKEGQAQIKKEFAEALKNVSTGTTSKSTNVFCGKCGAEIPTKCSHCSGNVPKKKARELHDQLAH